MLPISLKLFYNKCIGDDTKAAARQSLNCIRNQKINVTKNDFQYNGWISYILQRATIITLISPGDCTLQCECDAWLWDDMPLNSPKRPPYWNSTPGFDFDHINTVDMSFCTSLRNFIQIGPPSAEIMTMADLSHLGFYGSNNGLFWKAQLYNIL